MNMLLALVAGVFFILLRFFSKQFSHSSPKLGFSDLKDVSLLRRGARLKLAELPVFLKWSALIFFLVAFVDPHYFSLKTSNPRLALPLPDEGIAIYLVVDQSGSMAEEISAIGSQTRTTRLKKIDLLKQVTKQFIENRPSDLIGLISFARRAPIHSPLTLDHQTVSNELAKLVPLTDQKEGGTAIGYAIYKTVNLIRETKYFAEKLIEKGKPAYSIKNSIIVLITDGFQNVNPEDVNHPFRAMDLSEAAKFAKSNDVKLYAINVDPAISRDEFGPQRRLMQRITAETGGRFYSVNGSTSLEDIYEQINAIEKTKFSQFDSKTEFEHPETYARVSFYPILIALGMFSILIAVLLETTILRRAP